ncbi:MAG: glycerol-3-phosphate dehydrogenase/oxidase, partial [Candidatus Omnitrophota bacterium]|nr:glycerol-3-phosphate dehydrogenase/oxidase [Candidatus Omnitrophota bacterium]
GTSSKTSKLIHGGLRYLEYGHLRLVFESLRERQTLRTIAPSLVHPLSLMLPVYEGDDRSAWKVNVGLWLYDVLTVGRGLRSHRMLSAHRALALEPGLRIDGFKAAGLYADCQMDDARVCLSNILQAVSFGASCCNYTRLRAFLVQGGILCGAAAEDVLTGRTVEIHARVVVNAAGPWADRIRQLSDTSATARLAPTKGIHLIIPRVAQQALFVQTRTDHRLVFILPWGDYSLVGTTETALDGSLDSLCANAHEVGYLLEQVNHVLPGSHVQEDDVISTFAGARPLLSFTGSAAQASREHQVEVDRCGLVSVMGGKYTTYRVMAKDVVDTLVSRFRWRADRCLTDQVSLLETPQPIALDHWRQAIRHVDPDLLARLLTRYGAGAFRILQLIDRDQALAQPVCPHHECLEAELLHAIQQEFACTITDVLARRTRIAFSSCQGLDLLSTMTRLFQHYALMPREAIEQQVEGYHQFLARGLAFRPALVGERQWSRAESSDRG